MALRADQDVTTPPLDVGYCRDHSREMGATTPLWPETGQLLGLSRAATYRAAARGDFPVVSLGGRRLALTVPLLRWLGIPLEDHDEDES